MNKAKHLEITHLAILKSDISPCSLLWHSNLLVQKEKELKPVVQMLTSRCRFLSLNFHHLQEQTTDRSYLNVTKEWSDTIANVFMLLRRHLH